MSTGCLYLCATPIGNREDISARVLRVLEEADLIAAEDTRHSRRLLQYYGIDTPLISYHEHNKYERAQELISRLLKGEKIALISDAGTPVISDPGEVLVQKLRIPPWDTEYIVRIPIISFSLKLFNKKFLAKMNEN